MVLKPVENLRFCVTQRPPGVIFITCLLALGLALLSFSFYVRSVDLRDPDIDIDWNVILGNMAKVDYCATEVKIKPTEAPAVTSPTITHQGSKNYSIAMMLTITPPNKWTGHGNNITLIKGSLFGKQLGFHGDLEDEQINVTFHLPAVTCDGECKSHQVLTCVQLQAPEGLLPTDKQPKECVSVNETSIGLHSQVHGVKGSLVSRLSCKGIKIKLQHATDTALTVMLSLHDRSVASLHLLHTSYFVFVMAVTIFFITILRQRKSQFVSAQMLHT